MVLFLIIKDYFILEIYPSLIKANKYLFLSLLPLIIVNKIFIFNFKSIEKTKENFNIPIIFFVIILY
jgi:hypothetical protein